MVLRSLKLDLGKVLTRGALQGTLDGIAAIPGGTQAQAITRASLSRPVGESELFPAVARKLADPNAQVREQAKALLAMISSKSQPS